jgi:hypothetical protein
LENSRKFLGLLAHKDRPNFQMGLLRRRRLINDQIHTVRPS